MAKEVKVADGFWGLTCFWSRPIETESTAFLDIKPMGIPLFVGIDELEKVSHRGKHAFANVISEICVR